MTTIWRFEIPIQDDIRLEMPQGAEVLTFQVQAGKPMIWARVRADAPSVTRRLRLAGTGHPLNGAADAPHVGSTQLHDGALVFHLFDLGEET